MKRMRMTAFGLFVGLMVSAAASGAAQPTQVNTVPSGSTVINFVLPNGTELRDQYAALGVTVSGGACANKVFSQSYPGFPPTPITNYAPLGMPCNGQLLQPITFSFAQPITFFGFFGYSNGTLTFHDGYGSLTMQAVLENNDQLRAFTDAHPFSSVIVSASDNGAFSFDYLSFAPAITTPEPSSMALIGTGLVALVPTVLRRRRH